MYHTSKAYLETKDRVELTSMEPTHGICVLSNTKVFTTQPKYICNQFILQQTTHFNQQHKYTNNGSFCFSYQMKYFARL